MSESCSDVVVSQQKSAQPPPIALGINVEKPKFPQYAVYSKRLESFEKWPDYLPVDIDGLVEAGLVYTGVGDSVRCYFCGGGLRNWERGDVPMEEHAKWYPKCPHVLLVKGQAYIDAVARGEKPEQNEPSVEVNHIDAANANTFVDSAAAQSCIQMGYDEELVRKAIDVFIKRNRNTDFKGKDLAEIIETEDELTAYCEAENVVDCLMKPKEEEEADEEEQSPEQLESLKEENQRLKENHMCKICLDQRADVIFLPCGHMVSCPQCAPALRKCPICRKTVNGQIKAFFALTKSTG